MAKRSFITSGLQLELLEDRTLLASDIPWLDAAVDTDSLFQFDFIWFPSDSQIALNGENTGGLTINVDYLPNNVKSITASSFTDVTLVGTRGIDRLHAVDLGNLNVNIPLYKTLVTEGVDNLRIIEPAPFTLLGGDDVFFETGDLTNTFLYSDLDNLEIEILNPDSSLWILSLNPEQTVSTNFEPKSFNLIGLDNSQLLIQGESASDSDSFDTFLAGSRVIESQDFAINDEELEFSDALYINNLIALAESSNNGRSEALNQLGPLESTDNTPSDEMTERAVQNEQLEVEDNAISDYDLWAYALDNFYNSNAWLPEERVADETMRYYEHITESSEWIDYTTTEYGSGIVVEAESSEKSDGVGEITAEPTWLDKVELRLNEYLARTNNTRLSLGDHLLLRVTNEFTPGERPGLIVDTKTPSRNNFNPSVGV